MIHTLEVRVNGTLVVIAHLGQMMIYLLLVDHLAHRFPLDDVDVPRQGRYYLPDLYGVGRVAGLEPCNLNGLCSTCLLSWVCAVQILCSISQRYVGI